MVGPRPAGTILVRLTRSSHRTLTSDSAVNPGFSIAVGTEILAFRTVEIDSKGNAFGGLHLAPGRSLRSHRVGPRFRVAPRPVTVLPRVPQAYLDFDRLARPQTGKLDLLDV
jgi:hypothetical protein